MRGIATARYHEADSCRKRAKMDIIEVSLCQEFGLLKNATKYAV